MNFWEKMKNSGKPILCLAPMADITDAAFRHVIAKNSKITPHFLKGRGEPSSFVTYTEFVSADGLVRAPEKSKQKLPLPLSPDLFAKIQELPGHIRAKF